MYAQEIVIAQPIQGYWAIYNPPGHPVLAFDFLAVDERKSLYSKGKSKQDGEWKTQAPLELKNKGHYLFESN